jgi:hypothetical protein
VGCAACDNLGYRGRVGIFEMLLLDDPIRNAIRSGGHPDELRTLARSSGMKTMQEDALEKMRDGLTTLQEVLRVVPFNQFQCDRCPDCSRSLAETFLFCPYCGSRRVSSALETSVSGGRRGA